MFLIYYLHDCKWQFDWPTGKSGATNLKGGGGGQCIEQRLVYTVKTLKFEKGGGHDPPPLMVVPPLPTGRVISRNLKLEKYRKLLEGVNSHEAQIDTHLTLKN